MAAVDIKLLEDELKKLIRSQRLSDSNRIILLANRILRTQSRMLYHAARQRGGAILSNDELDLLVDDALIKVLAVVANAIGVQSDWVLQKIPRKEGVRWDYRPSSPLINVAWAIIDKHLRSNAIRAHRRQPARAEDVDFDTLLSTDLPLDDEVEKAEVEKAIGNLPLAERTAIRLMQEGATTKRIQGVTAGGAACHYRDRKRGIALLRRALDPRRREPRQGPRGANKSPARATGTRSREGHGPDSG